MKKIALALSAALATPLSFAGTTAIAPGTLSTTGPTLDHNALFAATVNPAMADLMVAPDEQVRLNYFVGMGTNVEIGDANAFIDKTEELIDILDDPSLATGSTQDTLDEFNAILHEIGEQGYVKNSTRIYLPGLPVYYKSSFFPGTVYAEVAVDTQWRLSVLDDELQYNNQNNSFTTGTAAYVKSGIQQRISVGYGRELFEELSFNGIGGRLTTGVQVNIYKMELSKQIFVLEALDGEDIQDTVQDQYDNHLNSTVALGVDAGIIWDADRYRLGFSVTDINSPKFKYGDIGLNCEAQPAASAASSNCNATSLFVDEIDLNEVHTKHATARTDVTVFPLSSLSVSGSLELASYSDIVGTDNQWASMSMAYSPQSRFIPAVRAGVQKNLVGSQLTSIGLGFTLFQAFNFDLATSTESIEHEGSSAPRRFSFSIGFEESF